ncbi:MAG: lysylphosphatidylglycerol synthase domain-containing protein [Syntrophaceae bacterium]
MKKFHCGAIAFGLLLLGFLVWETGLDALWREVMLLGLGLVPFTLIEGIVFFFHTIGFRYCLSPRLRAIPFHKLFGIFLSGHAVNYFTPTATIGGEVVKAVLLTSNGSAAADRNGTDAATGVIIGKLSYALTQFGYAFIGSIIILSKIHLPSVGFKLMFASSAVVGAGIIGFLLVQKYGKLGAILRWLAGRNIGGRMLKKGAAYISGVDRSLADFYRDRPLDLFLSIFWHAVGMSFSIVKAWYFLYLLSDGDLAMAAGVWFLGTWLDLITFPIPLEIGVQESIRVIVFTALGFTMAMGLTYGLALRIEQIFWAIAGFAAYAALARSGRAREQKVLIAETAEEP